MPVVPPLVCKIERHARAVGGRNPHEVAERRKALDAVAQMADVVRRHFLQVVQAANVTGRETGVFPVPLEERDLPSARHRRQKSFFLQCPQCIARKLRRRLEVIRRRRIVALELREVDRLRVPRDRDVAGVFAHIKLARRPPSMVKTHPVM